MIIKVTDSTQRINIGIRGENEAVKVEFDLTPFIADYGNGVAVLLAKRSQDSDAYPVSDAVQDGDTLVWTLTSTDTYYEGHGKAEVFWYVDSVLAKSMVYSTYITNDIGTPSAEPPEPYDEWIETLTELGAETLANAQRAEAAEEGAVTAQGKAEDAQTAAETAQGKAEDAQRLAEAAQEAAEIAQGKAEDAQDAAEYAQGKAEDAQAAAEAASGAILDLTASATVNSSVGTPSVSVEVTESGGHKNMAFAFSNLKGEQGEQGEQGIQGETGATGATPNLTIGTVQTLNPDQSATASITGTAEDPVLNLGIPKGQTGANGQDGQDGADGYSPTATVTQSGAVTTIEITDKDGTTSAEINLNDYAPVIVDTASGAIASFPDGSDSRPVKALSFEVNPVQDLHGQASPYPAGGGKNKYDKSIPLLNGYIDSGTGKFNSGTDERSAVSGLLPAGTYTISKKSSTRFRVGLYASVPTSNTPCINFWNVSPQTITSITITTEESGYIVIFFWNGSSESGTVQEVVDTIQIELGSTATAYAPYSNICPISGRTEGKVYRTGINIWDEDWEVGAYNPNGTASAVTDRIRCKNHIPVVGGNNYYLNVPSGVYAFYMFYDVSGNPLSTTFNQTLATAVTAPSNASYMLFYTSGSYGSTYHNDISINYPSTDHSYHSGANNVELTIPFSQTVYGGTVDVVRGELVVDSEIKDLGTLSWTATGSGATKFFQSSQINAKASTPNTICSWYKYASIATANTTEGFQINGDRIRIRDHMYVNATGTEFKSAVDGAQIVYELATPITVSLTAQQLATLLGENRIFASTGDVTCQYRADTTLYIQKMIANALNA